MADHIPFVTGKEASRIVRKIYPDSIAVRVPLERATQLWPHSSPSPKLWIDPGVDGCDDIETRRSTKEKANTWYEFTSKYPNFHRLGMAGFLDKPVEAEVKAFVESLLTSCLKFKPSFLTVPQLPLVGNADRNKINRTLASAAGKWKSSSNFTGRLILPLIFKHQDQLNGKTSRNPKVHFAEKCYQDSQADGIWVVDKSLADDNGSPTLKNKRFPGIIALHEELNEKISCKLRLGGPYWGLNLVLWARGLIDNPTIGVGSGYQFYLSGGHANTPSAKIAIPSLRRRVSVGPALTQWLDASLKKLPSSHPAHDEFFDLRKRQTSLSDVSIAREQVATFYKQWFDSIATTPQAGRSLALFQDLSSAYAFGKSLPPLVNEGTARRPEVVAESLMLSCL